MSIYIQHSLPPWFALPWDCIGCHDEVDPMHINVCDVNNADDRLALLTRLRDFFSNCPKITLYTGILTSDIDAPCGCSEYSNVCDYHRYREYEVAECWCSEMFGTKCAYHAEL